MVCNQSAIHNTGYETDNTQTSVSLKTSIIMLVVKYIFVQEALLFAYRGHNTINMSLVSMKVTSIRNCYSMQNPNFSEFPRAGNDVL